MNDYSLLNHILIQSVFGAGSNRAFIVLQKILSANMIDRHIDEILKSIKFSEEAKTKLTVNDYKIAESIVNKCKKHNVKIMKFIDDDYPTSLINISVPPIVLYYKGNFPDFDTLPSITIVGPRKSSEFGLKSAFSLGYRLSKAGMIVVSGGALGSDTAAHKGVYAADGTTVVVLGCGIDCDYLPENKDIRNSALKNGCVVSEYPPLTRPSRRSFPIRNRIMSGLTLGTIIVEAGEKSGALITARTAADEGRDVFVVPGNPSLKEYKGSNALLRDGAKPLLDASDVFNEYLPLYAEYLDIEKAFKKPETSISDKKIEKIEKNLQETLSNEAKMVYNNLNKQIFMADDLSFLNLPSDLLLSALTELELENLITALPGGKYEKK